MFRNYFKTAIRNFKRNKSYALINTLGLAIGITACFLIFLVVQQATAEKYFGDWANALGKTIMYQNKNLYTVSGILKNIPNNSDFPLSVVVAYSALRTE